MKNNFEEYINFIEEKYDYFCEYFKLENFVDEKLSYKACMSQLICDREIGKKSFDNFMRMKTLNWLKFDYIDNYEERNKSNFEDDFSDVCLFFEDRFGSFAIDRKYEQFNKLYDELVSSFLNSKREYEKEKNAYLNYKGTRVSEYEIPAEIQNDGLTEELFVK